MTHRTGEVRRRRMETMIMAITMMKKEKNVQEMENKFTRCHMTHDKKEHEENQKNSLYDFETSFGWLYYYNIHNSIGVRVHTHTINRIVWLGACEYATKRIIREKKKSFSKTIKKRTVGKSQMQIHYGCMDCVFDSISNPFKWSEIKKGQGGKRAVKNSIQSIFKWSGEKENTQCK